MPQRHIVDKDAHQWSRFDLFWTMIVDHEGWSVPRQRYLERHTCLEVVRSVRTLRTVPYCSIDTCVTMAMLRPVHSQLLVFHSLLSYLLHQAPWMVFSHHAPALVFNSNDLPPCCVCSAVSSTADCVETPAEAAGGAGCEGDGAGAAWDGVSEGAVLPRRCGWRSRAGLPPEFRCSSASPPKPAQGQEAAEGGGQGQHPNVSEHQGLAPDRTGGRGLQAVHYRQAGGGRPGPSRPSVRLPEDLRVRGLRDSHRVPEFSGILDVGGCSWTACLKSQALFSETDTVVRDRSGGHYLLRWCSARPSRWCQFEA